MTGGLMNYVGDISPGLYKGGYHPSFGAFYKWHHDHYFISRFSFNYGSISGADKDLSYNKLRNLSFASNIYELSYMTEFNFVSHGYDKFTKVFTPYVCLGLSGFYFDPYTIYKNQTYELRKYGTEGQFLRHDGTYSRIDYAIPFGGGFKLHLSENFIIGIEMIWRRTGTDHLDDLGNGNYMQDAKGKYIYTGYPDLSWDMVKFNNVPKEDRQISIALSDRSNEVNKDQNLSFRGKQRGNPYNKDWFMNFGITLSYKIVKYTCNKGNY